MNNTSNCPTNQIRTQIGHAEIGSSTIKSIASVAKTFFESAEHAARIAVVVLVASLLIISVAKVVDSGTSTAHYCDAITEVVYVP